MMIALPPRLFKLFLREYQMVDTRELKLQRHQSGRDRIVTLCVRLITSFVYVLFVTVCVEV
jgi:hypothetical protein